MDLETVNDIKNLKELFAVLKVTSDGKFQFEDKEWVISNASLLAEGL